MDQQNRRNDGAKEKQKEVFPQMRVHKMDEALLAGRRREAETAVMEKSKQRCKFQCRESELACCLTLNS